MAKELGLVGLLPPTALSRNINSNELQEHKPYSVLPPRFSSFASPPVSTSSFYGQSRHSNDHIAESPHLMPGHARTAVGAIVALQHQHVWPDTSTIASSDPWLLPEHKDWHYDGTTSPCRSANSSGDENEQPTLHYPLDDPVSISRSPIPGDKHSLWYSPISTGSCGSPSSRACLHPAVDDDDGEMTRHILPMPRRRGAYDFEPLKGGMVSTHAPNPMMNLSAMSEQESHARIIPDHDIDKYSNAVTSPEQEEPLDSILRNKKYENQRRAKEQLIFAAVERLQDDLQVICEVEACAAQGVDDWMVTISQQQSLMTGFSNEQRTRIRQALSSVLKEMSTAPLEEFFLSPTQIPLYSEPHKDLRDALCFCRSLLEFVPENRHCHWRLRAKSALGLIPPESPEIVRGGDTSLFSLAAESATPMTSNVSLTTTITSAAASTPPPVLYNNGLAVRRTIKLVSVLLHNMTTACLELEPCAEAWRLGTKDSIRKTEGIKRSYLQLLAMDAGDIRVLVESFELREHASGSMAFTDLPPPRSLLLPPVPDLRGGWQNEENDDDLRRHVGSADNRDDVREVRDGPGQ
jgi:hypothetical protein